MNSINLIDKVNTGYLELFIGPMWSGKTSELVKLHKQYTYCGVPVLAINYKNDTRYAVDKISTHDLINIPCVSGIELSDVSDIVNEELTEEFNNSQIILINEGQFFKDIVLWVKCAVEVYHKRVYICGLDGDFKREMFGDWLLLIPFCDRVTKLHSLCGFCKENYAIFTHRSSHDIEQELIGTDEYQPLCRRCYNNKNTII